MTHPFFIRELQLRIKVFFVHFGCCFRLRSFPIDTFLITKLIPEIFWNYYWRIILNMKYYEIYQQRNLWCCSKLLYSFTFINIFIYFHFHFINISLIKLTNLSIFTFMGSCFRYHFPSIYSYWRVYKILQGAFFQ